MSNLQKLLNSNDGDPVNVINADGKGPFVFVCEHASNRIPQALNNLALSQDVANSHVAWDPGALAVSNILSQEFNSPLVVQNFSRLVYDCNRPPHASDAMPLRSEIYNIPGNRDLTEADRKCRIEEIYQPFHRAVELCIANRLATGLQPVVVTIHSFTPVYFGKRRNVELGILHDEDSRFADAMLAAAPTLTTLVTERNQPYGPKQGVMHTLQVQAQPLALLNVMVEIRNDLIANEQSQRDVAGQLSAVLKQALEARSAHHHPARQQEA